MNPGCIVKFRPQGPWRIGPDSGARDRVDTVYHSDSLYSAVTSAMLSLGLLEEWLDATARNLSGAAVRFSSCFPFQGDTAFVVPPKSVWPPAASSKVRWKGARFIPLPLAEALLSGGVLEEDRWSLDGQSECLVPHGRGGPFRIGVRSGAAVDRLGAGIAPHATACLEFGPGAGLWAAISFADESARTRWLAPVQSALRLLADSGFGGERSRGWGRCDPPEFIEGALPDLILPRAVPAPAIEKAPELAGEAGRTEEFAAEPQAADIGTEPFNEAPSTAGPVSQAYWLLSLFAPTSGDSIEWERGYYSLMARGGRVDSPARSGDLKKSQNMVSEGSVVFAAADPRGSAADVAPDGFPHPVYRAGFAVAIPIPQAQP
jgi:CRISPR type III-A-associated RAMP protein Csm4